MPSQPADPEEMVRRSGRRYVPERALITGAPGGPVLSGVTTISDVSGYGVGLLQTYPIEPGQRFMLLKGPEATAEQLYEVVYCREQSGVFRIGARCIGTASTSSAVAATSSAN